MTDSRRGTLQRLTVLLVYATALTPLVSHAALYYPSTTARAVFFRTVTAGAGVLAAALLLIRGRRRKVLRDPACWALAGSAVVAMAAALAGPAPWKGVFGGVERMWGAMAWLHLLAFYVAARVVLEERDWGRFFAVSLAVSSFVAAYGFLSAAELLPGWARPWPVTGGAMGSTIGNPGFTSAYLLLHLAVAAAAWRHVGGRIGRAAVAAAGALAVAGLVAGGSRSVAAGLGVGVGLVAVAAVAGGRSRRIRLLAAVGLAGVVTLAGGLWIFRDAELVRRLPAVSRLVSTEWGTGNLQFRLMAWEAALDGFAEHPVLGAGPENFDVVWDRHVSPAAFGIDPETWRTDRTHNAFLQPLATLGLFGAVAYLALWLVVGRSMYRLWRSRAPSAGTLVIFVSALVGYAVYQFFWFENVHTTFAFVALVAYLGHRTKEAGEEGEPETDGATSRGQTGRTQATVAVGVGVILLAGSGWYHGRLLAGAHHVHNAVTSRSLDSALQSGRHALAVRPPGTPKLVTRYAGHLIDLRPRVAEAPEEVRGPARDSLLAAMRRTERELGEVIDGNPGSARLRYVRSALAVSAFNISEDRGDYEAAVASMAAAVDNAPTTTAYHRALAQLHRMARNWREAERVLDQALRVYPTAATRLELARTLLAAGEPRRGAPHLISVLRSGHRPGGDLVPRYRKALREAGAKDALEALERAGDANAGD